MAKDRFIQALRGTAIAAVVLIHCLPQCSTSVAVRPFLNWAVAAFLFLSGLLTTEENLERGGVFKRRVCRTLPPYLIWSVACALILQRRSLLGTAASVFSAGASAQMYFIAVYLQLMILTPLLYRLLRRSPLFVYLLTPTCLALYELMSALGFAMPILGRLFPMWLIFYVVGLDWGRWGRLLKGKIRFTISLLAICLAVQLIAGYAWLAFGDYNMATTQLKISSMMTSLCVIAMIMVLPATVKHWLSQSALTCLGDLSFGIYLCHMLVLAVVRKALVLFEAPLVLNTILAWVLTLLLAVAFCMIANKLLPKRIAKALGMA